MTICIKSYIEKFDTHAKHLDVNVLFAEAGHAKVVMPIDERHRNGVGFVHGGAIFALADIAFAAACNACKGTAMLNVAASISYVKAGKEGPITAEAKAIHEGKTLSNYEVTVYDAQENVLAVCQITGYRTHNPLPECSFPEPPG